MVQKGVVVLGLCKSVCSMMCEEKIGRGVQLNMGKGMWSCGFREGNINGVSERLEWK